MKISIIIFSVLATVASAEDNYSAGERTVVPLVISSKATASSKTPATLADVTFTVAATGNGAVNYSWDFGDGTPAASGASVTHAYNVVGVFTATATISDAAGQSGSSSVVITVSDVIKTPKLFIALNFKKSAADSINLTGSLRLLPGKLAGQVLALDVGGVVNTATLDEFGTAKLPGGSIKIFAKARANAGDGLNAKFYLRLSGDFQAAFADETLTNRTADREPVKIKLKLTLGSILYSATVTQEYDAVQGLKGITR